MMASTPKQVNGNASPSNGPLGKRKKSKGSKSSYLSKWLDKSMSHVQEPPPPPIDVYENFPQRNLNWPVCSAQFAPGYDPYRYNMYGMNEPTSLPSLPTYYNPVLHHYPEYRTMQCENKSIQVQRPRIRRRSTHKAEEVLSTPGDATQTYMQPKNFTDSQDFASLPPIVTSTGDTNSNSDLHLNDKDDGSNARRFSDPCVRGLPDVADHRPTNGDVESDSESSSGLSGSQVGSRLLSYLLDQISSLKIVNERLSKDLQETRAELENLQHHSFYSKGATSLGAAGVGGQYSPGYLTELVREIRDATRIREEAMFARLRSLVLEKTDNGASASADSKVPDRTLEEIRGSLRAADADKRRMMDRISKLEDELRLLRVANGLESNDSTMVNGNAEDAESEQIRLRKEVIELRKSKESAEEYALKLERLVTQLRSKCLGPAGPDSLSSDEPVRRTGTFMCGPVTDL